MSAPCPIFGFVIRVRFRDASTEADSHCVVDDLRRVLDSNDLVASRGANGLEFVISREGSQTTQSDRELVFEWAERWKSIAEIDVSDLIDLQSA
jgi:uncharacterized protein YggL (DUF469 family)